MSRSSIDDEDDNQKVQHLDPRVYMRCMPCIIGHKTCDRRLPYCKRCRSSGECWHPRVADYRDGQDALDSFRRSQTEISQKRSPSETAISVVDQNLDLSTGAVLRAIAWQEGDISHSQKKCPNSIVNIIRRHKRDFKDTQLALPWPRDKTVHGE